MNNRGERVTLTVPVDAKYISLARLVAAGVAARANLSIDAVEDLKIAVSEACTNVTEHAFGGEEEVAAKTMELAFYIADGRLTVEVEDEGCGFDPKHLPTMKEKPAAEDTGLGLYLISELMDEVQIQSAPGSGTKIIMTKRSAR